MGDCLNRIRMLQYIKIRNLALLDEVSLEIDSGFTAVTGETGAGKSVLLGALSLLAGARTDKAMIRQGKDQLEIEGAFYFDDSKWMDARLEKAGLPICEGGSLLLSRTIHRSRMPKMQVNGSMATLTQLQEIGEGWIDFHGPGEPQKLFQEKRQLEMLDSYAGNSQKLAKYAGIFQEWQAILAEIETLKTSQRLDDDEIDFFRKQIRRMDEMEVSEASIETLERDFSRMSQSQELVGLALECSQGLSGEDGVSPRLEAVVQRMESLAEVDTDSEKLVERARSLLIEFQDLGDEVGRLAVGFDFDSDQVEAISERMDLWQELRRKHGGSVASVLAKREELAGKLALQEDIEGILSKKQEAASKLEHELSKLAGTLDQKREKSAIDLSKKVSAMLSALGFKKARLAIEIVDEPELKEHGASRCRFLFAPNVGQDLLPLNKIASSGETARVMLALKAVLAEADATPLLVFDEVDANVGGEVGRSVGIELARLAARHQVFCVTHLPQVASLAKNHFLVTKLQGDASTTVEMTPVHNDREKRLEELARMLGDRESSSALAHAKELLA